MCLSCILFGVVVVVLDVSVCQHACVRCVVNVWGGVLYVGVFVCMFAFVCACLRVCGLVRVWLLYGYVQAFTHARP